MKTCKICQNSENNRTHIVKEMMFGWHDEFEYLECLSCKTLQISDFPKDISRFYPADYYSLNQTVEKSHSNIFSQFKASSVANYYLNGRNIFGKWLAKKDSWDKKYFPLPLNDVNLNLNLNSKILDFGCGSGARLLDLQWFGFKNLTGIDEFIESDINYSKKLKILKKDIRGIDKTFDFIMAHHSIEHLPNPKETLKEFYRLLNPNKLCMIRIPLIAKAWEIYSVNWFQIDAPRHFFLFSEDSFCKIAEEVGFKVEQVVYDSNEFQFVASEKYKRGIPLNLLCEDIFTESEIANWKQEAEILNKNKKGDQAIFYLRKP